MHNKHSEICCCYCCYYYYHHDYHHFYYGKTRDQQRNIAKRGLNFHVFSSPQLWPEGKV